jgi:hypothetical protein
MNHATDRDLQIIEGLITGSEGTVTIRMELAAAIVDEIRKHRDRQTKTEKSARNQSLEIETILSSRTKEGALNLFVNGQALQLDLPKAREIRGMFDAAIEAAVSDQLIYQFLTTKVGLDDARASRALLDFRELRQGTRGTSWPT